ncbi:carboxypeptidase-like regulatory domain-containing protein [Flagellimonas sp. CMM7]|uniref:carboxypeptidase-like regulatory domain-containing protein n=1 Tax=Flagellimonas sp. CMM7 TaxID=2654676 RepID=UPI0013D17941|nr:carboxypeptidase-like regulatory domain-containing protein [Flagellimonas sp. CMM7]UII79554.1 carboxypeptidase-like regulatory domain-containing protein [Flagellimonas sp. CMM7]
MDLEKKSMGQLMFQRRISWTLLTFLCYVCLGCGQSDNGPTDEIQGQEVTGTVSGLVSDDNGNVYPGTLITISKGSETSSRVTDSEGKFRLNTKSVGTYDVVLELPLSTKAISSADVSVEVLENKESNVDFMIQPQPVKAHLNFGNVQLLEEIVDANGNTPTASNEPLYAANIFDQPLGLLTAIKAPDGHHVTLAEFKKAKGNLNVHCNGDKAFVNVALEGMIPNGTYTFWLAYLNKTRKVGEPIDFMNDFVNITNPPIGASNGSENIAVADVNGAINVTFEHNSCILTNEAALVIPVLYHINGKTFGGGHVPDPEEMVHMLAYFQ